jgi:hypothetical protein
MNTASPGSHVAQQLEARYVERDALGGEHVLAPPVHVAPADDQRADATGIPQAEDARLHDQRDHCVAAAAAPVNALRRAEHLGRSGRIAVDALELVREDVEQHLGVRGGVQVAVVLAHDQARQLVGVGQVAVVRQADAVRRVGVEGLRLVDGSRCRPSGSGNGRCPCCRSA